MVTLASLMPSSVHEPSLPFVPLPAQDGLELTHTFFRGRLCKKCRYFPTLFWPLQWFLLLASARANPHPCLTPVLGPASPLSSALPAHTHPQALWGPPPLPRTTGNKKSTERKKSGFLGRTSYLFIYFWLLLRVACGPGLCRFRLLPFPLQWQLWEVHLLFLCSPTLQAAPLPQLLWDPTY